MVNKENIEIGLNIAENVPTRKFITLPFKGRNSIPKFFRNLLPNYNNSFKLGKNLAQHFRKII